jgi:hypothetical protein
MSEYLPPRIQPIEIYQARIPRQWFRGFHRKTVLEMLRRLANELASRNAIEHGLRVENAQLRMENENLRRVLNSGRYY